MRLCEFEDGEIIPHEGEPGEFVYRTPAGEVEILTERGDKTIVLGSVRPVGFPAK